MDRRANVPGAKAALNAMKQETARDLGVNLKQGYSGEFSARDVGYVGGYVVRRLIEDCQRDIGGKRQY